MRNRPPASTQVSELSSKQVVRPAAALAYILTGISGETKTEPPSNAMPQSLPPGTWGTLHLCCFKLPNFGVIAV